MNRFLNTSAAVLDAKWKEVNDLQKAMVLAEIGTIVQTARLACPSLGAVSIDITENLWATFECGCDCETDSDGWSEEHGVGYEFDIRLGNLNSGDVDSHAWLCGFKEDEDGRGVHRLDIFGSRMTELGIDPANTNAVAYLRTYEWWTLTPESKEVELAKTLHTNP